MRLLTVLIFVLLANTALSQEPVVTLRSTVTGNQDQPKVMYILPWQPPGELGWEYAPTPQVTRELFREIDRGEFLRELEYQEVLYPAEGPSGGDD